MANTDEKNRTARGDSRSLRGQRQQPTLKTIAEIAGLAVPTVSRALSGAEDISKTTRARVRRIADEIGYVPNRAGVRLRTGRTNVISLVLSSEFEVMNHTARLINGVASGLRDTQFHLNITPFFPDEDPMRPIRYIVETRSADAVIFNQIKPEDPRVEYLQSVGFPFVTHGRTKWADNHPYFDYDNMAFGRIAVQALAKRGRRNIMLVAPPQDQNYGRHMVQGAQVAALQAGVELRILDKATSDHMMIETEKALHQELQNGLPLDGLICASNGSSIAAMTAAENNGLVIGDSVDIFTKEAIPLLKRIRSQILVVHEDVTYCGNFLAKAAMHAVLNPDAPPLQELEVPELP